MQTTNCEICNNPVSSILKECSRCRFPVNGNDEEKQNYKKARLAKQMAHYDIENSLSDTTGILYFIGIFLLAFGLVTVLATEMSAVSYFLFIGGLLLTATAYLSKIKPYEATISSIIIFISFTIALLAEIGFKWFFFVNLVFIVLLVRGFLLVKKFRKETAELDYDDTFTTPVSIKPISDSLTPEATTEQYSHTDTIPCENCKADIITEHNFCSACGFPFRASEKVMEEFYEDYKHRFLAYKRLDDRISNSSALLYFLAFVCFCAGIGFFVTNSNILVAISGVIAAILYGFLAVWSDKEPFSAILIGLCLQAIFLFFICLISFSGYFDTGGIALLIPGFIFFIILARGVLFSFKQKILADELNLLKK